MKTIKKRVTIVGSTAEAWSIPAAYDKTIQLPDFGFWALPAAVNVLMGKLFSLQLIPHSVEDKPALFIKDFGVVATIWCKHGVVQRANRPAVIIGVNGHTLFYYKNGVKHRTQGPAHITSAYKGWYTFGSLHRYSGPAEDHEEQCGYALHGIKMTKKEFTSLTKKRTPTEISILFSKEIDNIIGVGISEYKRSALLHVAESLKYQKADPILIKSIEYGALML